MEIWKIIPEFPNYKVSNYGNVKSIKKGKGTRANINNGVLKKSPQKLKNNYIRYRVTLRKNGKTFQRKVSHLVLNVFVGERPKNAVVRHLDGDSMNDNLDNLKWGTQQENVHDSIKHGTHVNPPIHFGTSHHNSSLSDKNIKDIRSHIYKHGDIKLMAEKYNVHPITISRIIHNRSY